MFNLDQIDKQILNALQIDGKLSIKELAQLINLSTTPTLIYIILLSLLMNILNNIRQNITLPLSLDFLPLLKRVPSSSQNWRSLSETN